MHASPTGDGNDGVRKNAPKREDEAPVHIVDYNIAWPDMFAAERDLLLPVLGPWLPGTIEHIGSTAVHGMPAKPVVDIMAGVGTLESSRDALGPIEQLGYVYSPYRPDVMHWFCKPGFTMRTHHLHLVPFRSQLWNERIAFRDRLRADSAVATEYAALKQQLAELHRFDREAYTEAKGEFIARVLHAIGNDES